MQPSSQLSLPTPAVDRVTDRTTHLPTARESVPSAAAVHGWNEEKLPVTSTKKRREERAGPLSSRARRAHRDETRGRRDDATAGRRPRGAATARPRAERKEGIGSLFRGAGLRRWDAEDISVEGKNGTGRRSGTTLVSSGERKTDAPSRGDTLLTVLIVRHPSLHWGRDSGDDCLTRRLPFEPPSAFYRASGVTALHVRRRQGGVPPSLMPISSSGLPGPTERRAAARVGTQGLGCVFSLKWSSLHTCLTSWF